MNSLVGKRYGRLVVIEPRGLDKYKQCLWLCKCDCGNEKITNTNRLNAGKTRSCGCIKAEGNNLKHGKCYTRLNGIYRKMKERCFWVNGPRYMDYGGRGITVCNEWLGRHGFNVFYEWAINNGYSDELSLDRIDVNGNYEPLNCRWATYLEQANNARSNHLINYNGETKTLSEWCRYLDLCYATVLQRLNKLKWTPEKAFTIETRGYNG